MSVDPRPCRQCAVTQGLRPFAAMLLGLLLAGGAAAQQGMKATAPEKMMPPAEKQRLEECQTRASQQDVEMAERAKFLMDCMKAKAEQGRAPRG
jgi:hypothetical protein